MAKTRFHQALEQKVKEAVESRLYSIARGQAADYPAYRESVGWLQAMRDILNMADEVEKELD